jgi:hypothetical protein
MTDWVEAVCASEVTIRLPSIYQALTAPELFERFQVEVLAKL